jgi:hypothetical protein
MIGRRDMREVFRRCAYIQREAETTQPTGKKPTQPFGKSAPQPYDERRGTTARYD